MPPNNQVLEIDRHIPSMGAQGNCLTICVKLVDSRHIAALCSLFDDLRFRRDHDLWPAFINLDFSGDSHSTQGHASANRVSRDRSFLKEEKERLCSPPGYKE